ncbi:MAG: glutaredoxin 3 [Gemmatimonadetes bacterium]|jgi:glutaredoxin 3|nr:glutaredoxin 3 [Gemmatimonadota bacterium]MBT7864243.1 glutaredoxin 3 [Gemmatimonadota bacterium]
MTRIEIYSSPFCPFCWQARWLLHRKGVKAVKIPIRMYLGIKLPTRNLRQMVERSGGDHTVPQIFVDGKYLGTEEHLEQLEASGQLDDILQGRRPAPDPGV